MTPGKMVVSQSPVDIIVMYLQDDTTVCTCTMYIHVGGW